MYAKMTTKKTWEKPWSMEEIIDNSNKWSLAGDVALLNTLKSFADNLLGKTNEINDNIQNVTNILNETSLQLNIAQNEFQGLCNNQFIESRVYEDDEILPQSDDNANVEEKAEPDRTEDIRLAALKGLEVLDTYFDKIEVSMSDSEDEDIDLPNFVLTPKDLYIDRPLPYVIGSEEWHKNWHVGLEDSSSDSEAEKVSDKFSESDSESDLPVIHDRSQIKGVSDTSSELDFSQKIDSKQTKSDLFNSSDSDDQHSVPVQAPISNKNFAEQLAAKLGNVIKQDSVEPQINTRPIQTQLRYGDPFFDEPPPLPENKGLFSGGMGLFDDEDEDEGQYSTSRELASDKSEKLPGKGLFDEESSDEDIFNSMKPVIQSNKSNLFTDEPPALDQKKPIGGVSIIGGSNMFNKKLLLKRQPSSDEDENSKEDIRENKTSKQLDLFEEEDLFKSSLNEERTVIKSENISKKINLFDSSDEEEENKSLFEGKAELQQQNNEEKKITSLFDDKQNLTDEDNPPKPEKKITLFDDDLFNDDLFSNNTKKKNTSALFENIDSQADDLFSDVKFEEKPKSSRNLFEDLISTPDDKNSINIDTSSEVKETLSTKEEIKVNDDTDGDASGLINENRSETKYSLLEEPIEGREDGTPPQIKQKISLFDSPPPETDDLFAEFQPAADQVPAKLDNFLRSNIFDSSFSDHDDLFGENPPEDIFESSRKKPVTDYAKETVTKSESSSLEISSSMRLFDPSPPPDDDWDIKSDNVSDENGSVTDHEDIINQKSSLFDDEPPTFEENLKKDVVSNVLSITQKLLKEPEAKSQPKADLTSPGKLKHNLQINVGALMPGVAPPKREKEKPATVEPPKEQMDKESSFNAVEDVEVLQSVTKDRARVPFNRRPSTRRGRKAALRNSGADFKLEHDVEDDPQIKPEETPGASDMPFLSKSKNSLFQQSEREVEKPEQKDEKSVKTNLFEDDDGDDDIFSSKKAPLPPTKTMKKSLFDDDDNDDDDIFKSFTGENTVKKTGFKLATERKIPKLSNIKKLENTKPEDDPLSALLK